MRQYVGKILAVLAGGALIGSAGAWEGPKVDYSADSYFEHAEGAMQGKVHYSPGKERREFSQDGQKMTLIMRRDKKVVWTLMTEDQMYMESGFPKEGRKDDLAGYKFETTKVGSETVNGIETTKNKLIMTGPGGQKMGGFGWISKEGIMVKVDAIAVDKGKKDRFKMELKNLQVGRQDPALFEVPPGFEKMDMSMGGLGKMMMGGGGGGGGGDKPAPADKTGGGEGFGLKDALKLFR